MKRLTRGGVLILCLTIFASAALASEQKIATFNMRKAFDSYYKAGLLNQSLKEEAAKDDQELNELVATAQKHQTEFDRLTLDANDQALTAERRETIKNSADTKAAEVAGDKRAVEEFYRAAQLRLSERGRLRGDDLRNEINGVVAAHAKAAQYSLVLDISVSNSISAVVLFTDGRDDLTDSVIKELNAAAPGPVASSTATNAAGAARAK
jgi:Skp family chaperone for outer membrane proteins